jgi:truncated hemoglobin YjbI
MMGSTLVYEGKYDIPKLSARDVPELHSKLHITDAQFDSFKSHMHTILNDMEKSPDVVAEVLELLEG